MILPGNFCTCTESKRKKIYRLQRSPSNPSLRLEVIKKSPLKQTLFLLHVHKWKEKSTHKEKEEDKGAKPKATPFSMYQQL